MISVEEVRKLAALARIELTSEEEAKLAKDMENILGYVEQIKDAPVPEEDSEKERVRNVLRSDENAHESGIHTEVLLDEAPKREGQYIKVKKILS